MYWFALSSWGDQQFLKERLSFFWLIGAVGMRRDKNRAALKPQNVEYNPQTCFYARLNKQADTFACVHAAEDSQQWELPSCHHSVTPPMSSSFQNTKFISAPIHVSCQSPSIQSDVAAFPSEDQLQGSDTCCKAERGSQGRTSDDVFNTKWYQINKKAACFSCLDHNY